MRSYVGRSAGSMFLDRLFSAKKYVYVASRWISREYAERLVELARGGVYVRVITGDDRLNEEALAVLRKALEPPLSAKLRLRSWKPPLMELGVIRARYLHVKLYIVDDELAVVGSANLTKAGMLSNIEHILLFEDKTVMQLKRDFEKLWQLFTEDKKLAREVVGLSEKLRRLLR